MNAPDLPVQCVDKKLMHSLIFDFLPTCRIFDSNEQNNI